MPHLVIRGAIAQLGERLLCKQEVGGSIPPGSTSASEKLKVKGEQAALLAFSFTLLMFSAQAVSLCGLLFNNLESCQRR